MANEADVGAVQARFATVDEEKFKDLINNIEAKNTKRATNTSVRLFREYLTSKQESADFETFAKDKLDKLLASFFVEMRNKEGGMYKKSTLVAYRHGIQRHLERTRDDVNIMKDTEFKKSQQAFKAMSVEMKKEGLAEVEHCPSMTEEYLERINCFLTMDIENAQLLQYKVRFYL